MSVTEGADEVQTVLDEYAERGLFRSLRAVTDANGGKSFHFKWHYGRGFKLVVDRQAGLVAFASAFPAVSPNGSLHKDLVRFVSSLSHKAVPDHRRIDESRVQLACVVADDQLSVVARAVDGKLDGATRALFQAINEVFFDFLPNSTHYDYQLRHLGLDPNAISFA